MVWNSCRSTNSSRETKLEQLSQSLSSENEYLIDMEGVNQISRSAADELYNIQHSNNKVYIVNMSPFISRMMDVVTKGRFFPRKRMARENQPPPSDASGSGGSQKLLIIHWYKYVYLAYKL